MTTFGLAAPAGDASASAPIAAASAAMTRINDPACMLLPLLSGSPNGSPSVTCPAEGVQSRAAARVSGRMRRYHVTTFGCQMNAHDSERIKGMLEELGLGEAPDQADADVLVFNTCTIREKPDQRFAAHLAQARALKDRDPEKVIAVGGCYAEAQRERLFSLYPYVDVAFGPGSIPHLGDWIGTGGMGIERGGFGIAEER